MFFPGICYILEKWNIRNLIAQNVINLPKLNIERVESTL